MNTQYHYITVHVHIDSTPSISMQTTIHANGSEIVRPLKTPIPLRHCVIHVPCTSGSKSIPSSCMQYCMCIHIPMCTHCACVHV